VFAAGTGYTATLFLRCPRLLEGTSLIVLD